MPIETTKVPAPVEGEPVDGPRPLSPDSEQWLPYYAAAQQRVAARTGESEAETRHRFEVARRILYAVATAIAAVIGVCYFVMR